MMCCNEFFSRRPSRCIINILLLLGFMALMGWLQPYTEKYRWKLYAKEMLCACTIVLELTDLVQLIGAEAQQQQISDSGWSLEAAKVLSVILFVMLLIFSIALPLNFFILKSQFYGQKREAKELHLDIILLPGTVVYHPERGKGVLTKVDYADVRGKPFVVEFSGQRHTYSIKSALKLKVA